MTSISANPTAPTYSTAYKGWVLFVLFLTYTSSYIDRAILGILQQPIKEDLNLADWQLGLLSGLTFAVFYAGLGIPIARLAERHNRSLIITIALVLWSGMTALCAVAQNYVQLLLFRTGVGVGEAGCNPPAHSLITDYFSPERRASALAVYSFGVPVGAFLGATLGGVVAETWNWRVAFVVVGLPGLLIAVLTGFTVKEPPRGMSDPKGPSAAGDAPSLGAVLRHAASKPSLFHVAMGATVASIAGYGVALFLPPFLLRNYTLGLGEVGAISGVLNGVAAGFGVLLGGFVTDWAGKRDKRFYAWTPAVCLAVATPLFVVGFLQPTWQTAAMFLFFPSLLFYTNLAPAFAVMHNMMEPRMRATAIAVLALMINLVGLGLGPMVVGVISDLVAANTFEASAAGAFGPSCPGGRAVAGAAPAIASACTGAAAAGVRWALVVCSLACLWAAAHFWLAARQLRRDME